MMMSFVFHDFYAISGPRALRIVFLGYSMRSTLFLSMNWTIFEERFLSFLLRCLSPFRFCVFLHFSVAADDDVLVLLERLFYPPSLFSVNLRQAIFADG